MAGRLKSAWTALKQGTPGRRFQDLYRRRREAHAHRGRRLRYIVAGIGLILLGAVLGPLPWLPGTPLIGVGALFVCSASLTTARAMDIVEVRIRRLLQRLARWFRR